MKLSILVLFFISILTPTFSDDFRYYKPRPSYYGSSQTVGNTTFTNGYSNGTVYTGTSQTVGNTTFHNGFSNNGGSYYGTTQQVGNASFTNLYGSGDN